MPKTNNTRHAGVLLVAVLGILTAFDSLGIDMYLPAFESMEAKFSVAPGSMSISLSLFMIGLALGQGLCGPLADSFGRKKPLLIGIVIFGVASAMAACTDSFEVFLVARFLQGLGGAAGLVIPRTITSDLYDQKKSASIFTILMQIQSISPIVAPLLGAYVLTIVGWQGIFWILTLFGVIGIVLILVVVPETAPAKSATRTHVFGENVRALCRCRRYWLMNLSFSMIMGAEFGYISASSIIYMAHFNATATEFSFLFALNSIGIIIFGLVGLLMIKKISLATMLRISFLIHIAVTALMLTISGISNQTLLMFVIFLAVSTMGFLFGPLTAEVMYSVPRTLFSLASAVMGVFQYAGAALASASIGILKPESLLPITTVMLLFSFATFLFWYLGSRSPVGVRTK